jgi:ketosteroid isomerase-like protein
MNQDNADTIRRVYEHWSRGDFAAGADLFDDASVFILSPEFPDAGIYLGQKEVERYMRNFLEPWERLTITLLELTEIGDTVVAEVRQDGTGELSGAVTGFTYFQVWTFRAGALMRLENFMRREQANEALGGQLG